MLALSGATTFAACGGDDDDEECGGAHNPCPDDLSLETPEGGQLFFEYVTADDDLAAALGLDADDPTFMRSIGFFNTAQTPEALATPALGASGCVNMYDDAIWPVSEGTSRTYADAGTYTVVGQNAADTDVELDIPLSEDEFDGFHRPLDHFYQAIVPHAAESMKPNSLYTVEVSGGDIPAATYEDAVFLPDHYELMNPGLNDDVAMVAGEDYTVEWEVVESSNNPEGQFTAALIILADPSVGAPVIFCVEDAALGTFTIPGEMITQYRDSVEANGGDPNNVILLRNNNAHKIIKLENDDEENVRRLDMVGVYCYIQLAATAAAAL
jgi:hypothetical protein